MTSEDVLNFQNAKLKKTTFFSISSTYKFEALGFRNKWGKENYITLCRKCCFLQRLDIRKFISGLGESLSKRK